MAEKYVGFDVHAATTSYCVQDSKGKVVAEGVVETGAAELVSLVKSFVGKIHLTFEEGTKRRGYMTCSSGLLPSWLYVIPASSESKATRTTEWMRGNYLGF